MLFGNGAGIAGSLAIVTVILLLFSVGYFAMARHVRNAGVVAVVAILAHNAMQIGLLGLFGTIAAGTFGEFGLVLPWYVWSYGAIALVAVLGYRRAGLSAKLLMLLVLAEFAIVLALDGAILFSGGGEGRNLQPFAWSQISSGTPSIGMLFCFAAFIGFEATTICSEEARNPSVTVPRATYFSVLAIGLFYILTSWLMVVGVGVEQLMPTLQGLPDPALNLFVWLKQLAVLGLMTLTSFAVVAFFARDAQGEGAVQTRVLPVMTGLVLACLFVIIFRDFGALPGAQGALGWMLPALVPVFGAVGYALASALAGRDPARFRDLGKTKA